ncbi:6-hydroxymethylpterin diphosphokinase MptE-like protein [Neptunicella marina]|uniref:Motility associated factor glycosyltransferase family protein n=1 Tax=Neptunicella marina TaxID=2125989 RepID=A0A8J6ISZ6_9ALTE|nr:6-hydroxymethylpterin diphosphokinase MptE-like protein [Neptunicella marina]MBC3765026.1 motility associated factor glycosyltransferase family protein [Neptunicella marina]
MLKNIRLHLEKDESKQAELEQQQSDKIQQTFMRSLRAFRQYIPSVLPYIKDIKTQNMALICNKFGETNIVDYGIGRTFYGLHPEQEVNLQFDSIIEHCPYIAFRDVEKPSSEQQHSLNQLDSYQYQQDQKPLPTQLDVMVVLGIGLGKHILRLVKNYRIKHLIIYEPEVQFLQSSVLSVEWAEILSYATNKGTAIYLQMEKDARNLLDDMQELHQHFTFDGFYLYQHYNHPVFSSISYELKSKNWSRLLKDGFNYQLNQDVQQYLPMWTPQSDMAGFDDVNHAEDKLFKQNLAAFERYFPAIHKEFKDYSPKTWLPVKDVNGEINLVHKQALVSWYTESPKQECLLNFENFSEQPNKDGLVLGYNGTKLKHYTHYQFVNQMEPLLEKAEEQQGQLPDTIKSLILFGIGTGYQLEEMFRQHVVEKLFICEPNRDFFYASLFAIDWSSILQTVDQTDARIYINIGDDGSHLFRDLLNQFYSVGPYILSSTYFYQSYYNANLVQAIAQLREQLQIVISMGEYYDHARFGIAHTTEVINRDYSLLSANAGKKLSFDDKEVPVFLVGNGPSLDTSIEAIKEWGDRAIVVSCGTSLQVLHKQGIVPDFHAEIEQNRSTFDWCCRVGDFDYLKKISLISCNGIHPDTCDLFKDVYVAFKEGESSTTSALEVLGEHNFTKLKFAFPTVSNFVMNLFTSMEFTQLYLLGVDLGFVDNKHHHSKQSGYYDNSGKEMYDYAAKNNTSLVVPGNFRKTVFTKHEFKVSKAILEQSLANSKVDCFNCSDGARVAGATPLKIEHMLITASQQQKHAALEAIKKQAFIEPNHSHDYLQKFEARFIPERLEFELGKMTERVAMPVETVADAEALIESQKRMLFASYQEGKSLLFFLLYGTVNYANAVFSKLIASSRDNQLSEAFSQAKALWLTTLEEIYQQSVNLRIAWDFSVSFAAKREQVLTARKSESATILCSYPNNIDKHFIQWTVLSLSAQCSVHSCKTAEALPQADCLMLIADNLEQDLMLLNHPHVAHAKLLLADSNPQLFNQLQQKTSAQPMALIYLADKVKTSQDIDMFVKGEKPYLRDSLVTIWLAKYFYSVELYSVFIPRLQYVAGKVEKISPLLVKIEQDLGDIEHYVEFPDYLAIPRKNVKIENALLDNLGNRGRLVGGNIQASSLLGRTLEKAQAKKLAQLMINGEL